MYNNQETNDISYITGKSISLVDDNGINKGIPYISKDGLNPNMDANSRKFDNYSMSDGTYMKKKEVESMFKPSVTTNVFGQTSDGLHIDMDRYDLGQYKNFEKPTERLYVAPIDEKSPENRSIGSLISSRSHIDNIRSEVNKKDNYKGRIKSGKSLIQSRGIQADVNKYKPYRDYENSPDKYFTTATDVKAATIRSNDLLKFTNRSIFNKNIVGNVKTYISDPELSEAVQVDHRQQLNNSNGRNLRGNNTSQNFFDYDELGYRVYPNEREVTIERNTKNNLTTYINQPEIGYSKESDIGYVDAIKGTTKQTTMYNSLLNPKTYVNDELSRDNLFTYRTDPTKELLSTGREPTLSNVKLTNGKDQYNTDTKKLDSDYISQYQTGITNIFSNISSSNDNKNTRDKLTLNNEKLSDRIYPELLDPFRNNPLTQPLTSYAYN